MISYGGLFALLVLGAIAWLWQDGLRALERANRHATRACREAGVQLLDGTVRLERVRIGRSERGQLALLRRFMFDFTASGIDRRPGVVDLGARGQMHYLFLDLPEQPTVTVPAQPLTDADPEAERASANASPLSQSKDLT